MGSSGEVSGGFSTGNYYYELILKKFIEIYFGKLTGQKGRAGQGHQNMFCGTG